MKRLDKDEALPAPLYVVAALLIALPGIDLLQSVSGGQPANVQWRFATVGVLSSYLATPLLGTAVAVVVASVAGHHGVRRVLVVVCFTASAVLVLLALGFILDALQLRSSVRPDARDSFEGASVRALAKLMLVAAGLAFLGLRARRIRGPHRSRSSERATLPLVTRAETAPRAPERRGRAKAPGQDDGRSEEEPARQ
ncbi:MAG TPA: hypothetical protein VLE53_07150 [Gemmatimonadaceae bacterium]|nr:hypothetical protein [Gemmatimonadaceae bacterium]